VEARPNASENGKSRSMYVRARRNLRISLTVASNVLSRLLTGSSHLSSHVLIMLNGEKVRHFPGVARELTL